MSNVDVIIPCYNYGRFLAEAVNSALEQQSLRQVLVIDDASEDDTPDVTRRLADSDNRVEFRRHRVNKGHIATYNEGLDWATADYLVLLSADDVLAPGALDRAATVLDAHANVGFVYGRAGQSTEPGHLSASHAEGKDEIIPGRDFIERSCRSGYNFVPTPTAVVRTHLQHRIGGYRLELPYTGDMELWLRFAAYADVCELHCIQACYRIHGQNMHQSYDQFIDLCHRAAALETLFATQSDRIEGAAELHAMARRAAAVEAVYAANSAFDGGELENAGRYSKYAVEICPEIAAWGPYRRLQLKQRLGPAFWSLLREARNGLGLRPRMSVSPRI